MQPAVPARWDLRAFRFAGVDDPAPLDPQRPVLLATARAEVDVAELVFADALAMQARIEVGAQRRSVPPSEEAQQKILHARKSPFGAGRWPARSRGGLWPFAQPLSSRDAGAVGAVRIGLALWIPMGRASRSLSATRAVRGDGPPRSRPRRSPPTRRARHLLPPARHHFPAQDRPRCPLPGC